MQKGNLARSIKSFTKASIKSMCRYFQPTKERIELWLLTLTLFATVSMSFLTLRQATNHFRHARTSDFVARFNSRELVDVRENVDRWLETGEAASSLYERAATAPPGVNAVPEQIFQDALTAREVIVQLRTLTNFFQEFGTALKHGSLDERYAFDLLGAVCIRYGDALRDFILESRIRRQRKIAYEEVLLLKKRMEELDRLYGDHPAE